MCVIISLSGSSAGRRVVLLKSRIIGKRRQLITKSHPNFWDIVLVGLRNALHALTVLNNVVKINIKTIKTVTVLDIWVTLSGEMFKK